MKLSTSEKLRQGAALTRRFFLKRKLRRSLIAEGASKDELPGQMNAYEFYIAERHMIPREAYKTTLEFFKEDKTRHQKSARRKSKWLVDPD